MSLLGWASIKHWLSRNHIGAPNLGKHPLGDPSLLLLQSGPPELVCSPGVCPISTIHLEYSHTEEVWGRRRGSHTQIQSCIQQDSHTSRSRGGLEPTSEGRAVTPCCPAHSTNCSPRRKGSFDGGHNTKTLREMKGRLSLAAPHQSKLPGRGACTGAGQRAAGVAGVGSARFPRLPVDWRV